MKEPSVYSSGRINGRTVDMIVRQWGITFSGDNDTSAENFLTRIEEGRSVSGLTDEELLIGIPFILDKLPLQWFRNNSHAWPTWNHFRSAFLSRFGDINYQWRLEEQEATRYQGADERTADYLTCLQGLFLKFQRPVTMEEQMDRAYRNMKSKLRRYIRRFEFNDYNQLTMIANEVERTSYSDKEERIPPSPSELFFPELAYTGKHSRSRNNAGAGTVEDLIATLTDLLKKVSSNNNQNGKSKSAINQNREEKSNAKSTTQKFGENKGLDKPKSLDKSKKKESSEIKKIPIKQEPPCFNCAVRIMTGKNVLRSGEDFVTIVANMIKSNRLVTQLIVRETLKGGQP